MPSLSLEISPTARNVLLGLAALDVATRVVRRWSRSGTRRTVTLPRM